MIGLPTRPLGRTGRQVSIVGLGGEGILRTPGDRLREARALITRALDLGVTYFDCARAYAASEEHYGASLGTRRAQIFLCSKSAERSKRGALADLHATLRNTRSDYLDLWQVHDVRTPEDLAEIFSPGGALDAFQEARSAGKVRFIGITGHHDPTILTKALLTFRFDTVLLPVNAAEPHTVSFLTETVPLAVEQGIGIIGMKVVSRGRLIDPGRGVTPERLVQFALSQPVSTVIIGCDTPAQLEQHVATARAFTPMPQEEQAALLDKTRSLAESALFYRPVPTGRM